METVLYADIIINISHEDLDRTFQYSIPKELRELVTIGSLVSVPFGKGNRKINGYILEISNKPKINIELIKSIDSIVGNSLIIESHLIYLAYWIKETFGSTMNEALKTVMPVKKTVKIKEDKTIELIIDKNDAINIYKEYKRKKYKARERILHELIINPKINYNYIIKNLKVSAKTINDLKELKIIDIKSSQIYRNPVSNLTLDKKTIELNNEQQYIVDSINKDYREGIRKKYLIHGITGSGKTEVYMGIIDSVIKENKQIIFLIPEIALTYQMVMRFYARYGDRVSIINSKMSLGERYDQSTRAKKGEIDIIIGPRSALFTPFQNLGLIIIDEEHETSYKSETSPKYHAVDVAIKRAELLDASIILGSATPSVETYKKALNGEYELFKINKRAKDAILPHTWIVDLREELKNKNHTIFSNKLRELINDRLSKQEQIMLFLNRRGYAGFVSCRECGHVIKCNHCDISLTYHNNQKLVCHYCNYDENMPKLCPKCNSKYISSFGIGTQKVEEMVKKEFPNARVLRMDSDTTKNKGAHERILKDFSQKRADILVGTQMIVKGHDYPNVTLVGILAADMSLHVGDFRSSERTFQLLCQAAGRAGRGEIPGEVVIQTYSPEHYSVITASEGDYNGFYSQEILYRNLMMYPPEANILLALIESKDDEQAKQASNLLGKAIVEFDKDKSYKIIGPAPAQLTKANDIYRYVIYIKHKEYEELINIKNYLEGYYNYSEHLKAVTLQFDFNPMSSY
ncbi:MAG TPA: primosomal protein N' [Clostridiales bacterium]|nr:primosomal protein N' [Clostridiales bacterium]